MNIRFNGLLLLLVILGSVIAVPAFAQMANSQNITNTQMNNSSPRNLPLPAFMNTNSTVSSATVALTVTTDKPSYGDGAKVMISGTTRDYLGDTPLTLELRSPLGNIIKVDQITVGTDKTFSDTVTATGALWQSPGTYTLSVFYGNNNAVATFQFSGSAGASSGPSTIPVDGTSYSLSYTITNGKVLDIKADPASKSLTVSIQTTGDGLLTITMPRALIDAIN
ncbi:MAG: hypothetical protein WA799_09205, partial [Nitrosotalea sp.]